MNTELARMVESKLNEIYTKDMVTKLSAKGVDEYTRGRVAGKIEALNSLLREMSINEKS